MFRVSGLGVLSFGAAHGLRSCVVVVGPVCCRIGLRLRGAQ